MLTANSGMTFFAPLRIMASPRSQRQAIDISIYSIMPRCHHPSDPATLPAYDY